MGATTCYGASKDEWAALKRLAKVDLLPVVSNPHAEKSPHTKMKALGKTPSLYNDARQARGFTEWTEHEATVRNIEAWAEEPDYGACIQTRRIRGLDIDVPDEELADRIAMRWAELIEDEGEAQGLRFRRDTGKKLLAFICPEALSKRSFVVKEWRELDEAKGKEVTKRWLVELLADGQQFVAIGTHPSGTRYEWAGGIPKSLPSYSLSRVDRAWRVLVKEFALEGVDRRTERRDPTLMEDIDDVDDPVAAHLVEHWETFGREKGMLYVRCPNEDSHSSDNGETQAAWLLAGTGNYRNGHFRCMHAGCGEMTDAKFFQAVGYRPSKAEDFEDLSVDEAGVSLYTALAPGASPKAKELKAAVSRKVKLPLPGFNRDNRGAIETSLENITTALRAPQACECEIAFDEFRGELMLAETPGAWRSFEDADAVELRIRLEALGFKDRIGREMMRDALVLVGRERTFDSAKEWLLNIVPEWDGVARIHRFWPDYLQTKDTPYTQALGNYSWSSQAARILDPGCQVDMVPVMVSPEGYAKTSVIAAIAPGREFFAGFNLQHDDEKLARIMRGCIVGELAELRGVSARDGEAVKDWITRREEKWTPKFKEYSTTLPRRMVLYGTTNDEDFLQPHMGVRRWLPVNVLRKIDVDLIERDRLQLWAEARDVWLCEGTLWEEVERLAKDEREAFQHTDPWHERVAAWLDGIDDLEGVESPRTSGTLRSEDVLMQCLGLSLDRIKKPEQMRVAAVLKALGMERTQRKVDGRNVKVWTPIEVDTRGGYPLDKRVRRRV